VVGRIVSMKNSNYSIGNQTRDLPACSAVPEPTAPPYTPPPPQLRQYFSQFVELIVAIEFNYVPKF
jgi:hypothetical protein